MANIKNAVKLGVFTLAIMNVTAVVSLRGLPRWGVPMGRRSLRQKTGIPRHLGTMDRKYDLVSYRIDIRCRIHRLHRNERRT